VFVKLVETKHNRCLGDAFLQTTTGPQQPGDAGEDYEAHMSQPQPPKFVLDDFIGTALSGTPAELHPFFESFRSLYTRKCVSFILIYLINLSNGEPDYGIN
jgi:hypothetical protein